MTLCKNSHKIKEQSRDCKYNNPLGDPITKPANTQFTGTNLLTSISLRAWLSIALLLSLFLLFAPYSSAWTDHWVIESSREQDIWRYVTGHFAHWSWSHWAMNLVGTSVYLYLFQPNLRCKEQWLAGATLLLILDLYLITLYPLDFYLGFSGILYGLYLYTAIAYWSTNRWLHSLVIGFIFVRTLPWLPLPVESEIGIAVAKDVHWIAICTAGSLALVSLFRSRAKRAL